MPSLSPGDTFTTTTSWSFPDDDQDAGETMALGPQSAYASKYDYKQAKLKAKEEQHRQKLRDKEFQHRQKL